MFGRTETDIKALKGAPACGTECEGSVLYGITKTGCLNCLLIKCNEGGEKMFKKMAVVFSISLMAAGTSVAAPESPEGGVAHAARHHEEHSEAMKEQEKDPLQFGPLKVGLDAMIRGGVDR